MVDTHGCVLAIINPTTGRVRLGVVVDELQRQASRHQLNLTIAYTAYAGHAVALARAGARARETLIAVGGDGTVSDVVTGMIGCDCALGIVPVGSTNMIAKELGIPRGLNASIHVAMTSVQRQRIDVARTGATTILHIAGAGFDAAIMRDANSSTKRRIGWLAYLPAAARHLHYPMFTLTLSVDDVTETVPARTVLCAIGGAVINPRFRIGENIDRMDGIIDVCIYSPPNLPATLGCAWWIARGTPGRSRWLRQVRGTSVRLDAPPGIPFEVDGDPFGELPAEISVLSERIEVIVPTSTA